MHIPDHYLSPSTCAVFAVGASICVAFALKETRKRLPQEKLSYLGFASALSFLIMMFNIPLPSGSSGHAIGAGLLAAIFGPWPAALAISIALVLQAVLFADGGLLSLGANIVNIAFVMPFVSYGLWQLLCRRAKSVRQKSLALGLASYVGINVAALLCATELGIQPYLFHDAAGKALYFPYPLTMSIPAMALGHLTLFGLVEGLFSGLVYHYLCKVAAPLLERNNTQNKNFWPQLSLILTALIVLCPLGLLSSSDAWAEWPADFFQQNLGYIPAGIAQGFSWNSALADYQIAGLPDWLAYLLAAAIATSVLVICFKLAALAKDKHRAYGRD